MAGLLRFSEVLADRRVALIYSFRAPNEPSSRWYDRWKTQVIMSYGEALERVGAHPFYCDIDTFCEKAFAKSLPNLDAAISLNAGVRPVSHFALVPAVAQWCQIPAIPCTADVVIAGERKDLGNLMARQRGLNVPKTFTRAEIKSAQSLPKLVKKPRDLGGSFGVAICSGNEICQADFGRESVIQEFIEGADVTIPIFHDEQEGGLCVGDATLYHPAIERPEEWFYDRHTKEAYVGGYAPAMVERRQVPVDQRLRHRIIEFATALGIDCFARLDFRVRCSQPREADSLSADDAFFIEVNPMPTVCAGLAFVDGVRSSLAVSDSSQSILDANQLSLADDFDIIAYVLANTLISQLHPAKMDYRNQIGS